MESAQCIGFNTKLCHPSNFKILFEPYLTEDGIYNECFKNPKSFIFILFPCKNERKTIPLVQNARRNFLNTSLRARLASPGKFKCCLSGKHLPRKWSPFLDKYILNPKLFSKL